ncbi:unnamed protein product [Trichobilharzia regenti]|nr:unnamed protein product [Trichobilharzia regenti]
MNLLLCNNKEINNTSSSSSALSKYWNPTLFNEVLTEKSTTPLLFSSSFPLFPNNSNDLLATTQSIDYLPAVQIQLYLSETLRRLDVVIKHARCLVSLFYVLRSVYFVILYFNLFCITSFLSFVYIS